MFAICSNISLFLVDIDLTPEEELTQEGFMTHCNRFMLGEDAQIMRRYLKLRMPFQRAPLAESKKPNYFLSADELREVHARYNRCHHQIPENENITDSLDFPDHSTYDSEVDETESEVVPIEVGCSSNESDESGDDDFDENKRAPKMYTFTQGAEDISEFFGGGNSSLSSPAPILTSPTSKRENVCKEGSHKVPLKRRCIERAAKKACVDELSQKRKSNEI